MNPHIIIYSKSNCPNCTSAKQLLKSKKIDYEEYDIEEDPDARLWLQYNYPNERQMPQVFVNDQRVGGLAGLQAALKQLGL